MNIQPVLSIKTNTFGPKPLQNSPSFGGQKEKLMKKILTTREEHLKKLPITFDEAVNIYSNLGFSIFLKRGSHAIVSTPEGNFSLVMPHGSEKSIVATEIKRLRNWILRYQQTPNA